MRRFPLRPPQWPPVMLSSLLLSSLLPHSFSSLLSSSPRLSHSPLFVLIFFSPTHLPPLIDQQLAARGATRIRASGVLSPHPTEVYLFTMVVGFLQVRTCATARSPLASPLAQLLLLLPACAHNPTACLCALAFCWQLQELQGRLKKAILEYVVLAGSSLSP